jgi:RNA polymerase sigma factor (sigma-70 family)
MTEVTRFPRGDTANLSLADLLRLCGRKLTDPVLWELFQQRFHRLIATYTIRTLRAFHRMPDADLVCDLMQDVYLRLVRGDGRVLKAFRGETDFSVFAFLGRITMGVVSDYHRSQHAGKRQPAEVVSIEQARRGERREKLPDDIDVTSLLSWIDVGRLIESEPDRRNATRNVLIFKLHYVEGLTFKEISQFPGFNLTETAIAAILKNLRTQLKKRMGR